MAETPRRRITVTSSFNESARNGVGVGCTTPYQLLQQSSGQIFKDDVNGFSSTSDICFSGITYLDGDVLDTQPLPYVTGVYKDC